MSTDRSDEETPAGESVDSPTAPPPPSDDAPKAPAVDETQSWVPDGDDDSAADAGVQDAPDPVEVADQGEAEELEDPPSIEPKTRLNAEKAGFPGAKDPEPAPVPVTARVERGAVEDDYDFDEDDEYEARKIRLSISRIDTWSTLKLSFLLSVAVGIGIIVASAVVWLMLDGMAVFTNIDDLLQSVAGDEAQIEILQYFEFNKVISLATIIAVADVIIITLIATLGSVIYNLVSSLIGGLKITLTDE